MSGIDKIPGTDGTQGINGLGNGKRNFQNIPDSVEGAIKRVQQAIEQGTHSVKLGKTVIELYQSIRHHAPNNTVYRDDFTNLSNAYFRAFQTGTGYEAMTIVLDSMQTSTANRPPSPMPTIAESVTVLKGDANPYQPDELDDMLSVYIYCLGNINQVGTNFSFAHLNGLLLGISDNATSQEVAALYKSMQPNIDVLAKEYGG
ncbi:MAG: hypothetical protein SP1CHLAM54_12100 [Chlamydiia bacterium]|nr:hypothetical protein [Chlamydiia bacterium]MCH9616108.1 hypothetical protein [Chlamydiia bacterium]MCH9629469.1 hypothetical protein [Chlamydiia bacterium]